MCSHCCNTVIIYYNACASASFFKGITLYGNCTSYHSYHGFSVKKFPFNSEPFLCSNGMVCLYIAYTYVYTRQLQQPYAEYWYRCKTCSARILQCMNNPKERCNNNRGGAKVIITSFVRVIYPLHQAS